MEIGTRVVHRAELGLALAPHLLQSIEVLQLATAELIAKLDAELDQNEVLEAQPRDLASEQWPLPTDRTLDTGSFDAPTGADFEPIDAKQRFLDSVPARANTLLDHVREQLAWRTLTPELHDRVLAVAEHLDERGFLPADAELAQALGETGLVEAIAVLRSLEPRGLGAYNAIDALLLQLAADDPDYAAIRELLTQHLELVAQHKLREVAHHMRCSCATVEALLERVRELSPWPAAGFALPQASPVRPDLIARDCDGAIEVLVDERDVPSLTIRADYAAMARRRDVPAEVRTYLRGKIEAARGLIGAVAQRRQTLVRVGGAILAHQTDFLRFGEIAVRPLKMAEIAAELGLHVSTISRAVAGKWVQTDRGVFALRSFFDGGRDAHVPGSGGGCGRRGLLQRIRELVAKEDPRRPLSDDDLVALLGADGLRLARRTVTKHRKDLEIPSSWERKRRAGSR